VALQVASAAFSDPFAALVAGYVLLRLGRHQELDGLASAVLGATSTLSGTGVDGTMLCSRPALAAAAD
jgi:hypothetical protein